MSSSKNFPFQPKQDVNECHFCLPQLRAVIHLTLSMRIAHEQVSSVRNAHCRIDQVNWITAHNYGEPKWYLFSPEKEKFRASTLPRKMCPRKQTTKPKLLILVSFFSEVISYTDTSYCTHIMGSIPFCFFWATLYSNRIGKENIRPLYCIFQWLELLGPASKKALHRLKGIHRRAWKMSSWENICLTRGRLVPSILGLGSMGNVCYSKIKSSSRDQNSKAVRVNVEIKHFEV